MQKCGSGPSQSHYRCVGQRCLTPQTLLRTSANTLSLFQTHMFVCMYIGMFVCMYVCMYVQYVCMYAQFVCMYVCMYIHAYPTIHMDQSCTDLTFAISSCIVHTSVCTVLLISYCVYPSTPLPPPPLSSPPPHSSLPLLPTPLSLSSPCSSTRWLVWEHTSLVRCTSQCLRGRDQLN